MPTYYVEDYDGERNEDDATEVKVVAAETVEDKTVKPAKATRKV